MTNKKTLTTVFMISLFFAVLSIIWFIFNMVVDIGLVLRNISCQFALIMSSLGFLISIISLRKLLVIIRQDIDRRKEKEKNIRDFHQYNQLIDPPIMNN